MRRVWRTVFTERRRRNRSAVLAPLNTADFSPYLGQLADLKVDAIYCDERPAPTATRRVIHDNMRASA